MANVGDLVQVPSKRVGQAPRDGVVVAVNGGLLRIRWSSGEESTVMPSMGSLLVVGKAKAKPVSKAAAPPRATGKAKAETTGSSTKGAKGGAATKTGRDAKAAKRSGGSGRK